MAMLMESLLGYQMALERGVPMAKSRPTGSLMHGTLDGCLEVDGDADGLLVGEPVGTLLRKNPFFLAFTYLV